jgi:hypothetical protein
MNLKKSLFLLAGAAVSLSAVTAMADDKAMTRDEVRALIAEMNNDAAGRTSLLQGGSTAGHDGKFYVASANGDFKLTVGGFVQFRYLLNFRDDNAAVTDNEFEPGFQMRRARIEFGGHVVNPNLTFMVSGEMSNGSGDSGETGNFQLKDAYAKYKFNNEMYIRGGQMKLPFLKEELVSDTKQMTVERGVVNAAFTQDRSQGVEFGYEGTDWRGMLAFSDGFNSDNTDFNNGLTGGNGPVNGNSARESDYAFTGRFEYKFAGKDWKSFDDFTSMPGSDFAAYVGAAAHYQQSINTVNAADSDVQYFTYTVDTTIKTNGFTAFVAFVGANKEIRVGGSDTNFDDFGLAAQVAYRFGNTEPFIRYDGLYYDDNSVAAGTEENNNFVTVGFNQFFAGYAARLTIDAIITLDDNQNLLTPVPGGSNPGGTGDGLLPSTDSGQVGIRTQFQLIF